MTRLLSTFVLLAIALALAACGQAPVGDVGGGAAPPAAPSNVTATPGPGYVVVNWQDNSDDETGFVVYRDAPSTESLARLAATKAGEVGANQTRFVDSGADPGGSHSYSVSAKGKGGESSQESSPSPVAVPVGIDAMIGTMNPGEGRELGTHFLLFLSFPQGTVDPETASVTISGPSGWNGGEAYQVTISQHSLDNRWRSGPIFTAPVTGSYRVELVDGADTYSATAVLEDAAFRFAVPEDISLTSASRTGVTATWTGPVAAESYSVAVLSNSGVAAGYENTGDESFAFDELQLEPGPHSYLVSAFPVDLAGHPLKIDTYGISYSISAMFVVPELGPACLDAATTTPITDPNLSQAIQDELGLAAEPTCEDLLGLTFFTASSRGISSLEGLQYAVNMFDAELSDNEIADLSPLAGLTALEKLHLNVNQIVDVAALANLTALDTLTLRDNQIVDISPLANLTALAVLEFDRNSVSDISAVTGLTLLEDLSLDDNQVSDLAPVDDLGDLRWLWIGGNPIGDISVLGGKPLRGLSLWGTNIDEADLDVVGAMDTLELLYMGGVGTPEMGFLAGKDLRTLGYEDNGVTDISVLANMLNLHEVYLDWNELTDIQPLLDAGMGLGEGEYYVSLVENFLDLSSGSLAMDDIQALVDRGVTVEFEPQRDPNAQ